METTVGRTEGPGVDHISMVLEIAQDHPRAGEHDCNPDSRVVCE